VNSLLQNIIDTNAWLIACPDCDLLLRKVPPPQGQKAMCPRCGHILLHSCRETVTRTLALASAGLLLFFPAIFLPLLTFQKLGMHESGNLLQTILEFIHQDYYLVAVVVFCAVIVFPLVKLSLLVVVTGCLKSGKYPTFLGGFFKIYCFLNEWAMLEVYLLGIMITIIKMYHSTDISFNIGFFCFTGLVLATMTASLTICKESFWALIESRGQSGLQQFQQMPHSLSFLFGETAASHNLILCRACGKLLPALPRNPHGRKCDRCGARLHMRTPASLSRTWALVITAVLLVFPANLLPIMHLEFLGVPSKSTILDGIRQFFQDGSYFIAIIILTASILIPLFKIIGLTIVLLTVNRRRRRFLRQKTIMFRFIEFIGRWSMLDIFVIALLGFFINFGFLSSIETAPAATYFCLVVICTMLATLSFDPRLMWDVTSPQRLLSKSVEDRGE
jgi:paraquat-inducible protein A